MTLVWRRLTPREIDHELLWLAVAGAGLTCLALTTTRIVDIQLPLCPFKTLTGLPCPTCGVTRAVMAMARLDLGTALAMNPLAVVGALFGACYLAYASIVLVGRLPRFRPRLASRDLQVARVLTLAVVAVNWIYLVTAGR
jgi:hypothetical protein